MRTDFVMSNKLNRTIEAVPRKADRRGFARRMTYRATAMMAFFSTLLSVSCLVNGTDARFSATSALATVRKAFGDVHSLALASGRDPAMMRVNPKLHGVRLGSRLDSHLKGILLDGSSVDEAIKNELTLGLVTKSDFSHGADARSVARVQEIGLDYGLILPGSLSPTTSVGGISSQILDHSVTSFFNQASIKNSFVGHAAETVEKKMKAEVALGGQEPDSMKHNLKFQMKASETKASMEYRGITNANLSYSIVSRKTNLELYEEITSGSNLVFTHSDEPSDRRDVVSLRLHW